MSDHSATDVRTVRLEGVQPSAGMMAIDAPDRAPVLVLGNEILVLGLAGNDGALPSDFHQLARIFASLDEPMRF